MPHFKGININVTDINGKPFKEYGPQLFSKMKTKSCHIEAISGVRFCVAITPDRPFLGSHPAANTRGAIRKANQGEDEDVRATRKGLGGLFLLGSGENPKVKRKNLEYEMMTKFDSKSKRESVESTMVKPEDPEDNVFGETPPFDFLAWIYIDGRDKAENGVMVYLDPSRGRYRPTATLKARYVEEGDGTIGQRAWIFTDVGIDSLLEQLDIESGGAGIPTESSGDADVDDLEDLLGQSTLSGAGKIVVEIKRVVTKGERPGFKPRFKAGENEKVDDTGKDAAKNITHTTSMQDDTSIHKVKQINIITIDNYDSKEGLYARFEFNYVSRHKLRALNMMDKNGDPVNRKDWTFAPQPVEAGKKRANVQSEEQDGDVSPLTLAAKPGFSRRKMSMPEPSVKGAKMFALPRSFNGGFGGLSNDVKTSETSGRGSKISPLSGSFKGGFGRPTTPLRRSSRLVSGNKTD